LGEDGIEKVELTQEHKNLQLYIKELQKRGIFIALVSRNELEDVQALFYKRSDYPLRWNDFSAIEVSWGRKADALERIAQKLRISTDAILFVDDNIGELAAVTQQLNRIHTLYADSCAELTKSAIEFYPGIWQWKQEADDSNRILDFKANAERDFLTLTHTDPTEYLQSLNVTLTFQMNVKSQLGRLSDLCRKTNQFNLSLRRLNEVALFDLMDRPDACVTSVHLSDRLSDSGIIAVIVAERLGDSIVVSELCISCRAIGRQLENSIILLALRRMPIWEGSTSIEFRFKVGERNQPAINWLNDLMKEMAISHKDLQSYTAPVNAIEQVSLIEGVVINGD
jgi:FkbH-like protein